MDINAKISDILNNSRSGFAEDELRALAASVGPVDWLTNNKIDWDWFDRPDPSLDIKETGGFKCTLSYYGALLVKHQTDNDFVQVDSSYFNEEGDCVVYKPGEVLVFLRKANTFILH